MIAAQRSLNRLWGSDWPAIASQWGLDGSIFHFNHGAYGAVPKVVRDQQKSLQEQIDQNPSGFFRRELEPLLESARLEMAAFCRASPDGFALVRNASEGMTIALAGVPLSTGQEVIITSHVYPSVRFAVEDKCKETGAKLLEVHLSCSDDDSELIAPILGAITEKTRLIVIDEIPWTTGCLFPVRKLSRELSKVVGENGIALLVDGAHAPGTYPLSVEALGADIWVGNFHKWVCAP